MRQRGGAACELRSVGRVVSSLCPYCAFPAGGRGGLSKEHPFIEALGGQGTIRFCRNCNSTLGHAVEGPMMAADQVLNLTRVAAAGSGRPLNGKITGFKENVTYDLVAGQLRSDKPVLRWEPAGDAFTAELAGSPDQVRYVLNQGMARALQLSPDEVEQRVADAPQLDLSEAWIETTLRHSVPLGERLAAKVALGAGLMADGDFGDSALACLLRAVMWQERRVERTIAPEALAVFDEVMQRALPPGGQRLDPFGVAAGPASRVVFLPLGPSKTAVFGFVAGFLVSLVGLVLDAPSPFGSPLSVTDASPPVVRRLLDDVVPFLQRY